MGVLRWHHQAGTYMIALGLGAALVLTAPGGHADAASRIGGTPQSDGTPNTVLQSVTVAPSSTDAWALAVTTYSGDFEQVDTIARRHEGKWSSVALKEPAETSLNAVGAASVKQIWAVGDRIVANTNVPVILRSTGGAFKQVKVGGLGDGELTSVAASSPTNVFLLGQNYLGTAAIVLHWNGKHWRHVPMDPSATVTGIIAASTSGPKNAWAIIGTSTGSMSHPVSHTMIEHWNGTTWSTSKVAPAADTLSGIATSGEKTAWAVGTANESGSKSSVHPVVLRYTGSRWKNVAVTHGNHDVLLAVSAIGGTAYAVGTNALRSTDVAVVKPIAVTLSGNTAVARTMHVMGGYTFPEAVSASTKEVLAVGSFTTGKFCATPFRPLVEQLVHGEWKPLVIPASVVPFATTGESDCP